MKYKRKTTRRRSRRRSRRSRKGGAKSATPFQQITIPPYKQDSNLRDRLEKVRFSITSVLLANGEPLHILRRILPNFTTESPNKQYFAAIILLIGHVSYHIQEFCFIYVKGGLATQIALFTNDCEMGYVTNDIDLFIKPTAKSAYSAKECGEIVAMFIFDVMKAIFPEGTFLNPIVRSNKQVTDVIKFSYRHANRQIIPLMDISFVEAEHPSLTKFAPTFHHFLVFFTPIIDNLISEKLRYMYVYRDADEYYNKSLIRSLTALVHCIRTDKERIMTAIDVAVHSLRLPEDEDDDAAKLYMIDRLNKLFS